MDRNDRIYIAGHRGMVGSAITRRLISEGYRNIVTRAHSELDLTDQHRVRAFFRAEKIDYVVLAAAKVGGILANNTYPANFIYENMMIEANVIHEAYRSGVERLLFLGSSCIYPKACAQPMKEEYLLTGRLEPTNEPYAVAKIAGIKLCESYNRQYGTRYRAVMPTNLYGPNDNFDLERSHVLPALIRKFHLAKQAARGNLKGVRQDEERFGAIPPDLRKAIGLPVPGSDGIDDALMETPSDIPLRGDPRVILWGTGTPRREFLYVDDLASACVFLMRLPDETFDDLRFGSEGEDDSPIDDHEWVAAPPDAGHASLPMINVGTGKDQSIRDLAEMVSKAVGFRGEIIYDSSKPDGVQQKLLDISKLKSLGWHPETELGDGIRKTYRWYCDQLA